MLLRRGGEECLDVEGSTEHCEVTGGVFRPLAFEAIPVELYAVVVGVVEVEGFADAVVGGAVKSNVGRQESAKCIRERGARGIENGEVIETGGAGRGRGAAEAFPGIEANVMMVSAGGEKGGGISKVLGDLKAEDAVVEGEGAIEVGNAEMDVAHACLGMDGCAHGVGSPFVGGGSLELASRATFHWPLTFFQKVM